MAPHLTRRAFLQVTAASSALIATSCTASPTKKIEPTRIPNLSRPHDLAGVLIDLSETTLTLQSPSRASTWPWAVDPDLYAPTRKLISRADLTVGIEVGVWVDGQNQQITSLQILPPFAGAHDFPDSVQ